MRKYLLLLTLLPCGLFAQTTDDADDTENFTISSANTDSRDRLIMEFNWNWWLNTPEDLGLQGKSRGFNFYFFYDAPIGGDNFAIAPGIGIGNSNIFHTSFLTVDTDTTSETFGNTLISPFPEDNEGNITLDFKKNKVSLTYVEIPVELRFRTNRNPRNGNRFKFAVGFKGGLLINSHTKYVGTDTRPGALPGNTDFVKYKEHRLLNVSNFRYGVTGRVGYGNVNIHAFYGLSEVFEEGQAFTANPLEIGISFNPF